MPTNHYLYREFQARLREDPDFFSFFRTHTFDGLWFWDLDQPEHEWISPEFWELFGYDPLTKKHLAAEWQHLIHPEDLETAKQNLSVHLDNPDHPYDQVVRYRHRLGHWVWVRCRGKAFRDPDGKSVRMIGTHVDVSELMESKRQLELQLQRYEAIEMKLEMATRRERQLELERLQLLRQLGRVGDRQA